MSNFKIPTWSVSAKDANGKTCNLGWFYNQNKLNNFVELAKSQGYKKIKVFSYETSANAHQLALGAKYYKDTYKFLLDTPDAKLQQKSFKDEQLMNCRQGDSLGHWDCISYTYEANLKDLNLEEFPKTVTFAFTVETGREEHFDALWVSDQGEGNEKATYVNREFPKWALSLKKGNPFTQVP